MIKNPINKSKIFAIIDCRLIKGEETSIRAHYHNVELAYNENNKHLPGGVALLIPKGAFVEGTLMEQILATIDYQGHRYHVATQYSLKGQKIEKNHGEQLTIISRDEIGILLGDFYSSHTEFGGHSDLPNGNELERVIDEYGVSYVPNKQNTFLSCRKGDRDNTIDVAFVNTVADSKIANYGVGESLGSDHLPLYIEFQISTRNNPIIAKITNEDKFKDLQREANYEWKEGPLTSCDIDNCIMDLENKIIKCKEEATHEKVIKTNAGVALSMETGALIKERRRLKRMRKNKNRTMTMEQKQRSNWLNREIKRSIDISK